MKEKLLYLAKSYDLVIGDEFQLFYRGVIRSMNPYNYYIDISCEKGTPYPRYFTYTPKDGEEGTYEFTVSLFNDYNELIETASSTLYVVKPAAPKRKMNILCFGDSLTFNGVWPYTGYERFTKKDILPSSLGFENTLNMLGTCKKDEIGYEGYGGWQWRHFALNEAVSTTSCIWIKTKNHQLDENDQHSVWKSDNLNWVLESIEKDKLKFKRGVGNYSCLPTVGNTFVNVEGGYHKDDIIVESYEFEQGNPFFDKELDDISFTRYCKRNNYEGIDYIYILLTWNGQYTPFNHDFSHFEPHITKILNTVHAEYPLCKVRLLGIQSPSVNGGIAANYGAHGLYHNTFGEVSTAYNYAEYLESLCEREEYKSFVRYIDTKAQFDVENNMPSTMLPVNSRSTITERIGTNGVHPTMEGYLQIGDVFYRALCADMKDESK